MGTPAPPVRPTPWLPATGVIGHSQRPHLRLGIPAFFQKKPLPSSGCALWTCTAKKMRLIPNKLSLCNSVRGWGLNNDQSFSNNQCGKTWHKFLNSHFFCGCCYCLSNTLAYVFAYAGSQFRHTESLAAACELLGATCGIQFPTRIKPSPALERVPVTFPGPPGNPWTGIFMKYKKNTVDITVISEATTVSKHRSDTL